MAGIILTVIVGGILVYQGITGKSLTEMLGGPATAKMNPNADNGGPAPAADARGTLPSANSGNWTPPAGGASSFKGPGASTLDYLAGVAQNQFHLIITATTNGNHVPGSYHYRGEAFDASGGTADMAAFAKFVDDINASGTTITELIHNPGYAIKDGKDVSGPVVYAAVWAGHRNHVHVAIG